MINWIKRLFEDANGLPDDARVAAFMIVVTFLSNSTTSVWMNPTHAFDPQAFGIGAGMLATGFGVWFGVRKDN